MRDTSAVSNGPAAKVIRTFATLVNTIATMNAVNMMDQQILESRMLLLRQGTALYQWRPLAVNGSMTNNASAVKKLRQKLTSKLCAESNCLVTTPAVDHNKGQSTMSATALV
jgi:hypothetical protein